MNEDFEKILKEAEEIHRIHAGMLSGITDPVKRHQIYCERLHGFVLGLYAANTVLNTSNEDYSEGSRNIAELIRKMREKDFYRKDETNDS